MISRWFGLKEKAIDLKYEGNSIRDIEKNRLC